MRTDALSLLKCPDCEAELAPDSNAHEKEIHSGSVRCVTCRKQYPVLAGVLILVSDVEAYLVEHVKGISRHVDDESVPKKHRARFLEAKHEIGIDHIEDDLEAERVTSLYVMNHYLSSREVSSPDPALNEVIQRYWDHGPFERIKSLVKKMGSEKRSLIELGCGVGGLFPALRGHLSTYLGLDSSFASIVLARHHALGAPLRNERCLVPHDLLQGTVSREVAIAQPGKSSNAEFIVCDLSDPPVKKGSWQMSAALNVIDMLPDPRALPKQQRELLSIGGVAIQSCPYIWHPTVAEELRQILPSSIQDSAAAVEELYREAGFAINAVERHVPWVFFKNIRQLEIYSVHLFSASLKK
jgi:SAM-dependent methyltransferase